MSKRNASEVVDYLAIRLASTVLDVEHLTEQNERMEQRLREVQAERDAWVIGMHRFCPHGNHDPRHVAECIDEVLKRSRLAVANELQDFSDALENNLPSTAMGAVLMLRDRVHALMSGVANE